MVNVEWVPIAQPPPPVRPLVAIKSCKWSDDLVDIVYHCACSNLVHVEVYRSGNTLTYAQPLNASGEKQYPTVNVTWDDERVDIKSICNCKAGCHFTREDGGSISLRVIA